MIPSPSHLVLLPYLAIYVNFHEVIRYLNPSMETTITSFDGTEVALKIKMSTGLFSMYSNILQF